MVPESSSSAAVPLDFDAPGFEQIRAVHDLQHLANVLLDDQHGVALAADPLHQLHDRLHDDRREPGRGLVEQQQLRPRHQRPADRAHLLLAARKRSSELHAPLPHARKQRIDEFEPLREPAARLRQERAHLEVLLDGEPRKQPPVLGHVRDAVRDHLVRRNAFERAAVHRDAAADVDQLRDGSQQRRLARAVRDRSPRPIRRR
jgi:hypothetical protein